MAWSGLIHSSFVTAILSERPLLLSLWPADACTLHVQTEDKIQLVYKPVQTTWNLSP